MLVAVALWGLVCWGKATLFNLCACSASGTEVGEPLTTPGRVMLYKRTLRKPLDENKIPAKMVAPGGTLEPEKSSHRTIDTGNTVMM